MNKNPFVPQPSYTPQQPPLPPGPPPPQPSQPDYSAYWAAAAAATQAPHAPPTVGAYNPQWSAPQPPARPPAEQSALYANYGYGNQQNNWQRQQQQQQQPPHQYPPPPPPMAPQHPPPAQPGYNPYQPTVGYAQPYVPQAGPPPVAPANFPPPQPQQPFYMQAPQHMQPQHHHQQHQNRHIHHTPPQHLPPAKRQRFDGPNPHQQRQPLPPQPQFSAPPPPPVNTGHPGPNQGPGPRGGAPSGSMGGRGGSNAQRGGMSGGSRGGRGGSMGGGGGGRGGMNNRGGRGGSMSSIGGGQGRGGSSGPLRGHNSRGNFGGNKDFHNRRTGGSFGGYQNQNSSFRGRGPQNHPNRGPRHDGGTASGSNYGSRDGTATSSFGSVGKKDENRRTLTDFKIVGLQINELGWKWGVSPSPVSKVDKTEATSEASEPVSKDEAQAEPSDAAAADGQPSQDPPAVSNESTGADDAPAHGSVSSPPSRIRIYFHTPVTADDSRPIPHNSSYPVTSDSSRKGKRKKLEDDDGDIEEGRAPPPPPQMGGAGDDHSSVAASVAPSVAETNSDGDWLMAAIVDGEGEAENEPTQPATDMDADIDHDADADGDEDDEYGEHLHVSQIVEADTPAYDGTDSHMGDTDGHVDASEDIHPPDETEHHDVPVDGQTGMVLSSEIGHGGSDSQVPSASAPASTDVVPPEPEQPSVAPTSLPPNEEPLSHHSEEHLPTEDAKPAPFSSSASTDQATNHDGSHDSQVKSKNFTVKSLQAISAEPTLLVVEDTSTSQDRTLIASDENDEAGPFQPEHLPEPPASPSSNTLSASTHGDYPSQPPSKPSSKDPKVPSANRLSISYAGGNRRLVIDAETVEKLQLFRREGRIEVVINLDRDQDQDQLLKGITVEGLSDKASYAALPTLEDASDETLPPFNNAQIPSKITMIVHLDTERPLSEPKWAKTGDIHDWLKSMFGRMFWVAGDAAEGWEKKITVVDPDPPPTIWTVLDGWAVNSPAGMTTERQRFLKTHMTDPDNVLEILLRLVRGERATPFSQSGQSISPPSISGPLLSALSQGSAHGAQQTHVSLAVLAMFRMTVEYAKKADGDKGKEEAESRVGEIIRCLPSHLIYKSLDGIFKEWRVEKKGGRS
ncbi:hypothetical protein ONZ45_g516 [Pleurotus djamor]|nr:hypothetical protein ONZ45_g516 [Pleurotus djamor]